ncbi:hypothetical protein LE181_30035 [Streptomyces sp. SCA3-4]|uniref:hypothetical protein n=1 Tax=Streptomyces sichuanensis TaxID=2871810 RepID=UPI001CE2A26F|nr:hypothetical protein [Streptomyces sichuanensis]MCA6096394.1 hypothetical protein [Streptomyces sichuanensis]
MSALSALALVSCSFKEKDPRAYPGTRAGERLESVVESYGLQLPSCDITDVGFSGSSKRPGEKLNLSFRAPEECVNRYLADHGVKAGEAVSWPFGPRVIDGREVSPTEPPFAGGDVKRFGWKLDATGKYEYYDSFTTIKGAHFAVLVDVHDPMRTIYMHAVTQPGP